jgi:hypothetical protein
MAAQDIVHLAIVPPPALEANLIERVAAIVNKNSYETRLLLTGAIPRIIAHYPSMQTAESAARSLKDLGLVPIVLNDSELRKPSQIFKALTLEFGEQDILFRDRMGHESRVAATDAFLILVGKMRTYAEEDMTKTEMKLNWGATLLTGGIPIWRRVTQRTSDSAVQTECFARLYGIEPSAPCVQILQHHMNYAFLGAKIAPSSLVNFNAVVARLREVFPQAIFDDRLAKPSRAEDTEIDCKLLYFSHLAMK